MATHSSILAWRIPGTEEPSGLPSMGSRRVGHNWSNLAAAAAAGISYSNCQRAKIKTISWKKPEDKTIYLHRSKDDNYTWLIQGKNPRKENRVKHLKHTEKKKVKQKHVEFCITDMLKERLQREGKWYRSENWTYAETRRAEIKLPTFNKLR